MKDKDIKSLEHTTWRCQYHIVFAPKFRRMVIYGEFKKEWDSHELEYQLMMMVLKARNNQNLTQSELAERTGLRQSNISRIEKGQAKPSLTTLCKIAHGLGKRLEIKFVNVK